MVEADQQARSRLVGMLASGQTPDSEAMAEASRHIEATDSLNRSRLREIVDRHGWPTRQQVGTEAMEGIFLLVQHASRDPDLQRRYLVWLERAYRAGELDGGAGQSLALLTDRMRINEGRAQLYGTQVRIEGGVVEVYPIEEPEAVDVRRAALGLPPLGEYLRLLREAHGLP